MVGRPQRPDRRRRVVGMVMLVVLVIAGIVLAVVGDGSDQAADTGAIAADKANALARASRTAASVVTGATAADKANALARSGRDGVGTQPIVRYGVTPEYLDWVAGQSAETGAIAADKANALARDRDPVDTVTR